MQEIGKLRPAHPRLADCDGHRAELPFRPSAAPSPGTLLLDHLRILLGPISYKLKPEIYTDGPFSAKETNDPVRMLSTGINNIIHYLRYFFPFSSVPTELSFTVIACQGHVCPPDP